MSEARALTVTQPWASLIAQGTKWVETRSWRTLYTGPLLIHAAKGWNAGDMRFAMQLIREGVLRVEHLHDLPRGAIIASVELQGCIQTEVCVGMPQQFRLGDFSPGRWAWILGGPVERFEPPIAATGKQGLWRP